MPCFRGQQSALQPEVHLTSGDLLFLEELKQPFRFCSGQSPRVLFVLKFGNVIHVLSYSEHPLICISKDLVESAVIDAGMEELRWRQVLSVWIVSLWLFCFAFCWDFILGLSFASWLGCDAFVWVVPPFLQSLDELFEVFGVIKDSCCAFRYLQFEKLVVISVWIELKRYSNFLTFLVIAAI